MSKNREHHIIWTTPCPICGAQIGKPCGYWQRELRRAMNARNAVHGERRKAWQARGNPKTEQDMEP